jgi:uncharacterized protein YfaS (alpha-2-macroglobulin family)
MPESFTRAASPRFSLLLVPLVFLVATIFAGQGFQAANPQKSFASEATVSATYSHGVLDVVIPFRAAHAGPGRLTVEVLDPEDHSAGSWEQSVNVPEGNGAWREQIKTTKPLAADDLVWHRLRYRFVYTGGNTVAIAGTQSISQILRTPVVHILAQQSYLSGSEAAVRVIVTDSHNELLSGPGTIKIDLLIPDRPSRLLFSGQLNRRSTSQAHFRFPHELGGNFQLHYLVETQIGATECTQPVRLEDKVSILLTTEKPLYQPGQTIHVRALALDRSSHEASANHKITLEVEDSRGNKVFKKISQTDRFGIASAYFSLADEVNLGTYHLRGLIGDNEAPTSTAEIALNVERYVLPKFKVAVELTGDNGKAKRGYRPGDHVTGTVRANYFFGKPVADAEITVKSTGMDVSVFEAGSVHGKTDHEGAYHFDLPLPNYLAGRPLSQGAARVLIEATVKDSAEHSETRGEPIVVSESSLLIAAIPEGGTLIPNLENQVFILSSYPDGTPAQATLTIHAEGLPKQQLRSDDGGVTVVRITPASGTEALRVEAEDEEGNRSSGTLQLHAREGEDQILLRTERSVYHAGERIAMRVFSTQAHGTAYLDIIKDGQTVLTRDVEIENGQAELSLTATPQLAGTVDLNAYLFGRNAQPVGDHRLVFVQPADELKIETTADAPAYKPGAEARLKFRVTNSRGQGVSAALGLQVVDEAVFALAEKQPGFAKVFFYLEQEVMKPRYEIHSIGLPEVVESGENGKVEQHERAARALFSATEIVNFNKFDGEFGRSVPMTKYAEYNERYQKQFTAKVNKLAEDLSRAYRQNPENGDLTKVFLRISSGGGVEFHDAWDGEFHLERVPWYRDKTHYILRSAGADRQFNTGDDMSAYLAVSQKSVAESANSVSFGGYIKVEIEHERGPFNARAEITGTVADPSGALVPGAEVELRESATAKTRKTKSNAAGEFSFSALPPGEYDVQITCAGFRAAAKEVTLEPRDHAILGVMLSIGASTETVEVAAGARVVAEADAAPGVAVGQMGGVMGGIVRKPPMVAQALALNGRSFTQLSAIEKQSQTGQDSAPPAAHVRSYFPEALYINPEIITDGNGVASITIPLADSITTWRIAMLASTIPGALGSATSSLKVFQDFFVDLDLPVTLTQGDRVSIPVAIYNYSGERGDVRLQLQKDDWFALIDDAPEKSVTVDPARVSGSQFTIETRRIGKFKLTLSARMHGASARADIVVREIEVIPNGREQNLVFNGRLEHSVQHVLNFPAASIPDASKIFVRLYPGPLSQVVEGMDSILRMPGGCFEQTSSSTYPNVLALDYMKRTKKLTPEVHAKAEGFISNGYQRLLTFEVPGGGFSWFGSSPANKVLTAYGLMEFSDMSKVYDVDPRLISRTQEWLAGQQQPDGSWKPDASFINEGATNRFNSDVLRITAYLAWSLENTGYQGPAIENAKNYIATHMSGKMDAYTLAVVANFATDYENRGHEKDRAFTRQAMQLLLDARTEKAEQVWWSANETGVYSTGTSATIETTGLAAQALLKWGEASSAARKAMTYLASKKDAAGTWGTTQATIMALRALLIATERGAADVQGSLEVLLNGRSVQRLVLTPENNDLLHQFVFKGSDLSTSAEAPKVEPSQVESSDAQMSNDADTDKRRRIAAPVFPNTVEIRFEGKGGLAYQVVGNYYLPWDEKPTAEPLSITVDYDRTHLAQNDMASARVTIGNNLPKTANMVMVDLGIPPGFDLLSEDLQSYMEKTANQKTARLEKFTLTATQAILYFNAMASQETLTLKFRLRAKYPIRARTFQSRIYEYYDPDVSSVARPVQLDVAQR